MEEWRDIPGYEGLYQVSNTGHVKSLDRKCGNNHIYKSRMITERVKNHYLQVQLYKNSQMKNCNVHRLVALAFIPNPENKPTVNHIDENKLNNSVDNLEWATHKENTNYGTAPQRRVTHRNYAAIRKKVIKTNKEHGNCRPVNQYDLEGNFVAYYESMSDAGRSMGLSRTSGIYLVCNHKCKSYMGYKWEYAI